MVVGTQQLLTSLSQNVDQLIDSIDVRKCWCGRKICSNMAPTLRSCAIGRNDVREEVALFKILYIDEKVNDRHFCIFTVSLKLIQTSVF